MGGEGRDGQGAEDPAPIEVSSRERPQGAMDHRPRLCLDHSKPDLLNNEGSVCV